MKTVLVVGGYGFLATNIVDYIEQHFPASYRVIIFDRFPAHQAGVKFDCVCRTYAGDFSDSVLIESIFEDNDIDLVIHSLSTTVPALSLNARYDVESNLLPTIGLLDAMLRHKVADIVYISSGGAVYGDTSELPYRESADVMPKSSYGIVKLAIEKYLHQYGELYGLRPLIVRLSNPYGPYHYSYRQGICNVALRKALDGDMFEVWGNGEARKDYIFVTDFVEILFRLLSLGVCNQVVNIGSGEIVSINGILEKVRHLCPSFKWSYKEASAFDVQHFELDLSLLHSLIGEYRYTSMDEGISRVYDWLK